MKIKNLTNSPMDLLNDKGEKVRIAARGTLEGFTPHPSHASLYRQLGYFRIVEDGAIETAPVEKSPNREESSLADQYRELTGKEHDKRWSTKRLQDEIEKLQ